ncbi:centrosomal of 85 kDa isoform X1, putative [Babesia ovata]|uniref:Centrosomal of 85 kDa isoform X1, putative n=1 Tax=Babesia ovata TaxID=189622 RepID=A0A2H6K788_9APIC|nr:centrosomal of 85 kDa isoform X1, putative [Babesia ovata]GBE58852.1 centrosomal of 85 kDa isoform X1, putative [Babesia ovata]
MHSRWNNVGTVTVRIPPNIRGQRAAHGGRPHIDRLSTSPAITSQLTRRVAEISDTMEVRISPREFCRARSYPSENELSSGQHGWSTSECSSSTCDTSGSQSRANNFRFCGARSSPLHSLKRSTRPKVQQQIDTKKAGVICANCDALRMQLTEATTQCYDQWISRIKVLEDMLQEKQKINDELQAAWLEQRQLVEEGQHRIAVLNREAEADAQTALNLKSENYQLGEAIRQKDELIEELCAEIKQLQEKNRHSAKLQEMDMHTIDKLRRMVAAKDKHQKGTSSGAKRNRKVNVRTTIARKTRNRLNGRHRIKGFSVTVNRLISLPADDATSWKTDVTGPPVGNEVRI